MDEEKPFGDQKKTKARRSVTKPTARKKDLQKTKSADKGKVNQLKDHGLKTKSVLLKQKNQQMARQTDIETELVLKTINKSENGFNIKELSSITKLSATRLYTIVHRLQQEGKIMNQSRGVYSKIK